MNVVDQRRLCRVCGYDTNYFPWGADGASPSHNHCACCGVEFGYGDNNIAAAKAWRRQWIENGCVWDDPQLRPDNWNFTEQINGLPREFCRYYVLGFTLQVIVTMDSLGRRLGAERPDPNTGRLVFDHHLLSRLEQSHEVEEIDETEFNRRCRAIFDKGQA